jgi:peptide deformylase
MQVIKAPNSKLRITTKRVLKITPAHLSLVKEMIKLTKTFKDPEGVGLASTQIGLDERFFVGLIDKSEQPKFLPIFNPKIIFKSKATKTYFEGCLSIPNYYGEVIRHTSIKVEYQNETGKVITETLKGIPAWIFQHEVDHLDGILFVDRVLEQKGNFYKFTGRDPKTGEDHFEEVTI